MTRILELTPDDELWIPKLRAQGKVVKGQPGVDDVHIPSAIKGKKRKKRRRRLRDIVKHYGPGPHPGTGTPQSVHGGEGSKAAEPEPAPKHSKYYGSHTRHPVVAAQTEEQRLVDFEAARERLASSTSLYRGMGVEFPDDLRVKLEELLGPAMEEGDMDRRFEAAEPILDFLVDNGGVGRHWTQSKGWADTASDWLRPVGGGKQWRVIVEIEPPDASMLNPLQDHQGMSEKEVTLKPDGQYTYKGLVVYGGTWWDGENLIRQEITKHYGPGPHPGTGTPQSVHGGGGGKSKPVDEDHADEGGAARPLEARIKPWDPTKQATFRTLWADVYDYHAEQERDSGLRRVAALMRADPRWDEAEDEWLQLEDDVTPVMDAAYDEAEKLQARFWSVAHDLGVGDVLADQASYGYASPTPWNLNEAFDQLAIPQNGDIEDAFTDMGVTVEQAAEILDSDPEHVVYTSAVETGKFKSVSYGSESIYENPRWGIVGVDAETGMVTLEERAHPMMQVGDGLGPMDGLGPLLGGKEGTMGPGRIEVPVETLFLDEDNPDGGTYVVLPEARITEIGDEIRSLSEAYSDFDTAYGTDPDTAMQAIDVGDYSVFSGGLDLSDSSALVVNDSYNGTGVMVAEGPDDVPLALRNLWANTAFDDHRWAIALQMAVKDEFSLNSDPTRIMDTLPHVKDQAEETYGRYGTALKVYARAVYDATQETLGKLDNLDTYEGQEVVPVMRGMGLTDAVRHQYYPDVNVSSLGKPLNYEPVEVTLNPLSSWSASRTTAASFGRKSSFQAITRAWVPADQVWGLSILGHGSYRESEVIVLGGVDSLDAEMAIATRRVYR